MMEKKIIDTHFGDCLTNKLIEASKAHVAINAIKSKILRTQKQLDLITNTPPRNYTKQDITLLKQHYTHTINSYQQSIVDLTQTSHVKLVLDNLTVITSKTL